MRRNRDRNQFFSSPNRVETRSSTARTRATVSLRVVSQRQSAREAYQALVNRAAQNIAEAVRLVAVIAPEPDRIEVPPVIAAAPERAEAIVPAIVELPDPPRYQAPMILSSSQWTAQRWSAYIHKFEPFMTPASSLYLTSLIIEARNHKAMEFEQVIYFIDNMIGILTSECISKQLTAAELEVCKGLDDYQKYWYYLNIASKGNFEKINENTLKSNWEKKLEAIKPINQLMLDEIGYQETDADEGFRCSLSAMVMTNPVYDPRTPHIKFEKSQIIYSLALKPINPFTRTPLEINTLKVDVALKEKIDAFVKETVDEFREDQQARSYINWD